MISKLFIFRLKYLIILLLLNAIRLRRKKIKYHKTILSVVFMYFYHSIINNINRLFELRPCHKNGVISYAIL